MTGPGSFQNSGLSLGPVSGGLLDCTHEDLSIRIERVLCGKFLQPIKCWPRMVLVKTRQMEVRWKYFFLYKMVMYYGNRLADISVIKQAVRLEVHYLSVNTTISGLVPRFDWTWQVPELQRLSLGPVRWPVSRGLLKKLRGRRNWTWDLSVMSLENFIFSV